LLDPRYFPDYSKSTLVDGAYRFQQLTAGGDITIVHPSDPLAPDPLVGVAASVDEGGSAKILVESTGDITLSESRGDFRIDKVSSSKGNVFLSATGSGGLDRGCRH